MTLRYLATGIHNNITSFTLAAGFYPNPKTVTLTLKPNTNPNPTYPTNPTPNRP